MSGKPGYIYHFKHEYLRSRAYMFVTFITRRPFYQIMVYRDTRAYILDPCIQEFFIMNLVQDDAVP